jgi:hypothetical protein
MSLRQQPRKRYDVFNINGEKESDEVMLLQFDPESDANINEETVSMTEAKWIFLTEGLGWKSETGETQSIRDDSQPIDLPDE